MAWSTDNVTSVTIDNNVGIAMAASGSKTVLVSATTTFTLTATGPAGTVTATATVTYEHAALAIHVFYRDAEWFRPVRPRVAAMGRPKCRSRRDRWRCGFGKFDVLGPALGHSYALTAYQNYGTPRQTSATASATLVEAPAALKIATTSPLPVADSTT